MKNLTNRQNYKSREIVRIKTSNYYWLAEIVLSVKPREISDESLLWIAYLQMSWKDETLDQPIEPFHVLLVFYDYTCSY